MRRLLFIAGAITLIAAAVYARSFDRGVQCPQPPAPEPSGSNWYQAVSAPRGDINAYMATLHSSGRFIAMVPDDEAPGCYIITYRQTF